MAEEAKLERQLVKECRARGVLCYKFVSPGRRGVPDRILIRRGLLVFVELKAAKGRLSELQKREHLLLELAGSRVRTVYDREQLERFLDNWFPFP